MNDVLRLEGVVSQFVDFEELFRFFVVNKVDLIQKHHYHGRLYEREELAIIQKHGVGCGVFVDIGCNVGNHAIFMGKVLQPKKVYAFEANPVSAELFQINVLLNNLSAVIDVSHLGVGLGRKAGLFRVVYPQEDNIGAARLIENRTDTSQETDSNDASSQGSLVPVRAFDDIHVCDRLDFIKIDVEGMEMDVLKGMDKTVEMFRPKIFIEVDNHNLEKI